ncbi:hypothetical protein AB3329_01710 [Streptococcus sp. H31]|uniref:hypothetical protein n=1 Tax=Streptococcus huangxiaojuni TaxID=3237239 RepID=UPI0034A44AB6
MGTLKNTINKLREELDAIIIYRKIDYKGLAIIPLKIVIVCTNLSKKEEEQVILHELEHIKKNHGKNSYASPIHYYKQEAEAEHGRISADIEHYITNTPKEYWNTFNFLGYFGISSEFESYVDEQFNRYK